jgi:hypothetical protein
MLIMKYPFVAFLVLVSYVGFGQTATPLKINVKPIGAGHQQKPTTGKTSKIPTTKGSATNRNGSTTTNPTGTGKSTTGSSSTSRNPSTPAPSSPSSGSTSPTSGSPGDVIGKVVKVVTGAGGAGGDVTQGDAASAIQAALLQAILSAVNIVSVPNGYAGNPSIKIPLPAEIQPVDDALRMVGMGSMMDQLTGQLNTAAEKSARQALPIFSNSIKQMTLTDAVGIVSNTQQDAATQFLKRTTTDALVGAFKPQVNQVLEQTMTTTLWSNVMGQYNKLPFVSPVNTDLSDYVTRKALDGLFVMTAQEEAKIRKDPAGTASDIISKVFGKYKK